MIISEYDDGSVIEITDEDIDTLSKNNSLYEEFLKVEEDQFVEIVLASDSRAAHLARLRSPEYNPGEEKEIYDDAMTAVWELLSFVWDLKQEAGERMLSEGDINDLLDEYNVNKCKRTYHYYNKEWSDWGP